jgi:hypothetical protein
MARLLEDLETGTPVYLAEHQVGEVRGVYAEGDARLAEYLAVYWGPRNEEVLLPTKDVQSLEAKGVILMGEDPRTFASLPAFDIAMHPTIRRIH